MKRLLLALIAIAGEAHATDLVVQVSPVVGSQGSLRLEVCTEQEYPTQQCAIRARVPARAGAMTVTLNGIPPGRYAVLAHHDRNDNGKVNTNWLGIPVEGVGVSRNATGLLGRPSFADAAIDIRDKRITLAITLRQEPER
ncbi:MAG TPA: DUF2141 domain-containing protein [Acetobacteraceae bacterium]|jgi:uncharacterized protein (DUF2141 family)|nr:DUF2141 domain-containing protein [Acetobacteraceae bacterium]